MRLEFLADVDRVQHRIHRGVAQSGSSVRQDVGERAHQHAEVAVEGADAADGVLALVVPRQLFAGAPQRGTGRNGSSAFFTATGPAPGPPPPWGVENVLCRLRCMASTPKSPGRAMPTSAFMLAPSM